MTEERFTPAGWRSLVPDFLESPAALTCPAAEPGTLSYEIIFPAMSWDDFAAIVEAVDGDDAASIERHVLANRIPIAYEPAPHVIDGREFRTVLFLDGHVELFHDRDWAKYVEPYLAYSDVR